MKKLTERQFEAVKLIYDGQKDGLTPTLFELAEKLEVSSRQTVKDLLDAIAKKGYLVRKPRRARAIILKPEAIREIEDAENFFGSMQLNLGIAFSETVHHFNWNNPSNIIINYGRPSTLTKSVIDSSDIIFLKNQDSSEIRESYNKIQFVAEKLNFDRLYDSTGKYFIKNYDSLIVTPIIPSLAEIDGYVIPDGHQLYDIMWSGVTSNHYFRFGKEYGSTSNISYIDSRGGQMQLFSTSITTQGAEEIKQKLNDKLKSWSQYVDFPIYGGALKKTGEVLFWSRSTDRDINDLRYFFLIDITKTNFQGSDKALLRDIAYNFPKFINNSTQ